jgi:hypothetical protein
MIAYGRLLCLGHFTPHCQLAHTYRYALAHAYRKWVAHSRQWLDTLADEETETDEMFQNAGEKRGLAWRSI